MLLTLLSIYVTDPISDTMRSALKLNEIKKKDQWSLLYLPSPTMWPGTFVVSPLLCEESEHLPLFQEEPSMSFYNSRFKSCLFCKKCCQEQEGYQNIPLSLIYSLLIPVVRLCTPDLVALRHVTLTVTLTFRFRSPCPRLLCMSW